MKRIAAILLFMTMLFNVSGCDTESPQVMNAEIEEANAEIKPTIPYKDRMFIYNNGLDIEYKQLDVEDENKVKTRSRYPIISGLQDKEIQDKLNKEIPTVLDDMLTQLKAKHPVGKDSIYKYRKMNKSANISYNHNNVIFIDFRASIGVYFTDEYYDNIYICMGVGYDLNTGNTIKMSDLFKPGVDYKQKINTYISQYIIENNYDDYEYEVMTKPFQGIREDQNYSLNIDGLMINLDEKNDDFFYSGYPLSIIIPLKYFGDDLYIFDKYFDEGKNIFEKNILTKKLLPNKIEFIPKNYLQEGNDKWHISIMQGEFINIPDKAIEEEINAMLRPFTDIDKLRMEAEEYMENDNTNYPWSYTHNIEVSINAGGYLSIISFYEVFAENKYEQSRRVYNYDFNRRRKMKFMDLFINNIDVEAIIKRHIREMNYPITEAMLEEGVKAAISSNDFSFSEYYIVFRFSPKGANIESGQEWIGMSFEEFGLENISILN